MMYYNFFLLFIIYSICGWCLEVVCKLLEKKRFINRGFLIGPYCPIYGWASLIIILLLNKYSNDPIILFFMSTIICSILEYYTSYFMEKLFKIRWWDYSKRRFNINGRICLETMIPFGLMSLLIIYIVNPFFTIVLESISDNITIIIAINILIIFIVDNIISFKIILNLKNIVRDIRKDSTELINNKVREIIKKKNILNRRLFSAFPHVEIKKIDFKRIINQKKERK